MMGGLCKANMVASCLNILGQAARHGLSVSSGIFSSYCALGLQRGPERCIRAYGTGGAWSKKRFFTSHHHASSTRRIFGCTMMMVGGALGLYHTIKLSTHTIVAEETLPHVLDPGLKFTLYQYTTCPYSSKVRAFLDYYGLPYTTVDVNPMTLAEIKWSEYQEVPILMVEGKETAQLNESSVIISALRTCMIDRKRSITEVIQYFPRLPSTNIFGNEVLEYTNKYWVMLNEIDITLVYPSKNARKEEVRWRQWADNWLANLIKPNIYRTPSEALASYEHLVKEGSFGAIEGALTIYIGAFYMFFVSKLLKIWYKLQDDVRQDLYLAVGEWMTAIGKKRKFMGGDKPNLADLAVYGVISAMEGLEAFEDIMENTKMKKWYLATEREVKEHGGENL